MILSCLEDQIVVGVNSYRIKVLIVPHTEDVRLYSTVVMEFISRSWIPAVFIFHTTVCSDLECGCIIYLYPAKICNMSINL